MAKQVKDPQVDPREAELVEDMTIDVMDYIYGRGADSIVETLKNSADTSQTMAAIAYKAVRGVAEKRKATATIEMDMDILLGVTTEAIDMVTEVAEAAGQVQPGTNINTLKEDTLLRVVVLHGEQLERTPEQREQAMTDLRDYASDGGTDKAFDYVNKRAKAEGLNTNDMIRSGNEMLYGSKQPVQDKLKESIAEGLMTQAQPQMGPPTGAQPQMGPPTGAPEPGLMPPPQMPDPLPTGPGIAQPAGEFPPVQAPNAELAPPPGGRY